MEKIRKDQQFFTDNIKNRTKSSMEFKYMQITKKLEEYLDNADQKESSINYL